MKLRHPALIKAAGLAGSLVLRLWMGTLRFRYRPLGPNVDPHETNRDGSHIYEIWHENMLLPTYRYARSDISILISQHADGQFLAEICRHLRIGLVRGSTSRGGACGATVGRANQQPHSRSRRTGHAVRGARAVGVNLCRGSDWAVYHSHRLRFSPPVAASKLGQVRLAKTLEQQRVRHRRTDLRPGGCGEGRVGGISPAGGSSTRPG